jgi:hypothetical protein
VVAAVENRDGNARICHLTGSGLVNPDAARPPVNSQGSELGRLSGEAAGHTVQLNPHFVASLKFLLTEGSSSESDSLSIGDYFGTG